MLASNQYKTQLIPFQWVLSLIVTPSFLYIDYYHQPNLEDKPCSQSSLFYEDLPTRLGALRLWETEPIGASQHNNHLPLCSIARQQYAQP